MVLEHLRLMRLTPARLKIGFNRKQEEQPEVNASISAHQVQLTKEDTGQDSCLIISMFNVWLDGRSFLR